MRVIKLFMVLALLVVISYGFGWYYITGKMVEEANKYAGKKLAVTGIDKKEYFLTFTNAKATGFPFKMAVMINGLKEESKIAEINYTAPIHAGYDIATQKIFISYDGKIDAHYKPVKRGFGAKLQVKDLQVTATMFLTPGLFSTAMNMEDPFELINHLGNLKFSTGKVKIYDLVDDEKFYDKEYEKLEFSFTPKKRYSSMEDFLNNIPGQYKVSYVIKNNPLKVRPRRLPTSMFFGFNLMPDGLKKIKAKAKIKTAADKLTKLADNIELDADISLGSTEFDIDDLEVQYKTNDVKPGKNTKLVIKSKTKLKRGFFDSLFAKHKSYKKFIKNISGSNFLNKEIEYIIAHKNDFGFSNLENSNYDIALDVDVINLKHKSSININDFSIFSSGSGIKLTGNSGITSKKPRSWSSEGVLYVKNYPSVIEFSSGYIYRFGKFRAFSDEARKLYIDVNKAFLKKISDHPVSNSNDLSLNYSIHSNNLVNAKFGNLKLGKITSLYETILYQKLLNKVGIEGDVISKMKEIIPDINKESPLLKQVLPKIQKKIIPKELKKRLPKEAEKTLNKLLPPELKEKFGKDLFKQLTK